MKYNRNCKWCSVKYTATRTDQKFHTTKCRNAFNSHQYRKRNEIYKQLAQKSKKIDESIDQLYNDKDETLIHKEYFSLYKIDIRLVHSWLNIFCFAMVRTKSHNYHG